jgi:hypothetical protein
VTKETYQADQPEPASAEQETPGLPSTLDAMSSTGLTRNKGNLARAISEWPRTNCQIHDLLSYLKTLE